MLNKALFALLVAHLCFHGDAAPYEGQERRAVERAYGMSTGVLNKVVRSTMGKLLDNPDLLPEQRVCLLHTADTGVLYGVAKLNDVKGQFLTADSHHELTDAEFETYRTEVNNKFTDTLHEYLKSCLPELYGCVN